MPYIANHEMRYGGKLYEQGDIVPLKFSEAQEYLKHGAVTKQSKTAARSSADDKKSEKPPVKTAAGNKTTAL